MMTTHRAHVAILVALAVTFLGGASAPASAGTTIRKIALGVSLQPNSAPYLDQFIADTGRNPALYSVWSTWGGGSKSFPTALLQDIQARAAAGTKIVPVVLWEPFDPANPEGKAYLYRKIIRGDHDAYIRQWAKDAKAYGRRVILRLMPEMNGYWWTWGTQFGDNTPQRFVKAWRHIWNIFKGPDGVGAKNVRFLWSPSRPCGKCDPYASVWPGNAYVNYAGFSAFNWGSCPPDGPTTCTDNKWRPMLGMYKGPVKAIMALTKRPIIVSETASHHLGGDKVAWITDGYKAVYAAYPRIKAILYFNVDTTDRKERDWRLTTPDNGPLAAYAALLTDPRFQGIMP